MHCLIKHQATKAYPSLN